MKLDPETREKAAQDAHAAANSTNWDLLDEGSRNVWREIADAVAATIPEPYYSNPWVRVRAWDAIASHQFFRSAQPIDGADVRVGDRVRAVTTWDGVITGAGIRRFALHVRQDGGGYAFLDPRDDGTVLYLLDRPDPDAALIRTIGSVLTRMEGGQWASESAAILAALRETHTIEPRQTGGDLHA